MRANDQRVKDLKAFEKHIADLWEAGRIKVPVHLSGGNEKELIEIFREIRYEDYVFSTHRNHYHALLKGIPEIDLEREILGDIRGVCGGKSGSMVIIDVDRRFYSTAIVGGLLSAAVGVALGVAMKKEDSHVWCFLGDGAADTGHFFEALRYAIGWELPITFVIEDNDRSTVASNADRWNKASTENFFKDSFKVKYYKYEPKYPHVGTGKYVNF